MKSAILTKSGFRLEDVNTPTIEDNQVLVKVTHCGVCSGDLHLYQNKADLSEESLSLGHEVIGVVEKVGTDVTSLQPGDHVTAVDGIGGYSEQFIAPDTFLTKVSSDLPMIIQMGEPIACCVHAVNRLTIKPNMKVAVVGCGFMGLVCQNLIHQRGCTDIVAFDLQAYRRDKSIEMGAHTAYDPREYPIVNPDDGEFDIVIEAAGVGNALAFCTDIINHHGQMLIVGYHQTNKGLRDINVQRWNYKAIDVFNGHVRFMDEKFQAMEQGLALCGQNQLDISPLLTSYTLDNIHQAFEDLSDPTKQLFKAVIEID